MVLKIIDAASARPGATILIEGVSCIVKSNDISKTGKHGHAKCRIEAIGIVDDKKRVFVCSGHERLDVPMVTKSKGQVLSVMEKEANMMDLETYETLTVPIIEELRGQINEGDQVEYWDMEGIKIIKRKM